MTALARADTLLSEEDTAKVELYLRTEGFQLSGPVSLYVSLSYSGQPPQIILRTKPQDHPNGPFAETARIVYEFESSLPHPGRQLLQVDLIANSRVAASATSTIGELFANQPNGLFKDAYDQRGHKVGKIGMLCESLSPGSIRHIEFEVRADRISSSWGCFGSSPKHLQIFKRRGSREVLVFEGTPMRQANGTLAQVKVTLDKLCNRSEQQPIIFRVQERGYFSTSLLAEWHCTIQDLRAMKEQAVGSGRVAILHYKEVVEFTFQEYIAAGMGLALTVFIDFTGSNGIPTDRSSLHYCTPAQESPYGRALEEVAKILLDYDSDKLVPLMGFGAKVAMPLLNTGSSTHHCFPLNGSFDNPFVFQLEGIKETYHQCLKYLAFSGPTKFAPLLEQSMKQAEVIKECGRDYAIFLVLTDGIIHDEEDTKHLLVACARLPMSVIIVGVGNNEDWGPMRRLDDDECAMVDKHGRRTERDLVQFVAFSDYGNNPVELAKQVLDELPRQVEEYHKLVSRPPHFYSERRVGAGMGGR